MNSTAAAAIPKDSRSARARRAGGAVPGSQRAVMKPGAPSAGRAQHRDHVTFLHCLPSFSKGPQRLAAVRYGGIFSVFPG